MKKVSFIVLALSLWCQVGIFGTSGCPEQFQGLAVSAQVQREGWGWIGRRYLIDVEIVDDQGKQLATGKLSRFQFSNRVPHIAGGTLAVLVGLKAFVVHKVFGQNPIAGLAEPFVIAPYPASLVVAAELGVRVLNRWKPRSVSFRQNSDEEPFALNLEPWSEEIAQIISSAKQKKGDGPGYSLILQVADDGTVVGVRPKLPEKTN